MTPDELRSVFHVDHHSQVPQYHLIQITHHLARRNINTVQKGAKIPHEKHQKPWKTDLNPPSLLNDEMFIKAKENIKDVDLIGDLNNTVSVQFKVSNSSEVLSSESDISERVEPGVDPEMSDIEHPVVDNVSSDMSDLEHLVEGSEDVHRMELEAFGRMLKLNLKKQEGLVKKDGVKLWRAVENGTQPHGVDYEEMESVSDLNDN